MLLTYSLSERGNLPIYEFLYRRIRDDILNGRLPAAEKLPSKRMLASHLKISVVTVENAYAQLAAEGYLVSEEKRGYFVARLSPAVLGKTPPPKTFQKDCETAKKTSYLLDLTSNEIASGLFPFATWSRLMRVVISKRHKQLLERVPSQGISELREAIADYLYQLRGMQINPEQIIIGAGTEYLYQLLIQLLGREKRFAVENPGYRKIQQIYEANRVCCLPLPLDKQGISMKSLRASDADIVHISPAHHYPTGIVMPVTRRQELLSWAARKKERYILEDEYDSEFRFAGKPIPPLFSMDNEGKVIYMNTFSKSISPSIRISYMILPWELMKRYHENLSFYSCPVPSFEQYTLAEFIAGGYLLKHVNRTRNRYRLIRDRLISLIEKSSYAPYIRIREEDAGLHFLMEIRLGLTDEQITASAANLGVRLEALSEHLLAPGNPYPHTFVVNYSSLSEELLDEVEKKFSQKGT